MADPIVFISTFQLRDARRAEFDGMFAKAVELIGATKPRTALYAAYADRSSSRLRVVHAFPDAAAIEAHFEGSDERSQSVADVIVPAGFALYGPAPKAVREQLRGESAETGVTFEELPDSLGGFLRASG